MRTTSRGRKRRRTVSASMVRAASTLRLFLHCPNVCKPRWLTVPCIARFGQRVPVIPPCGCGSAIRLIQSVAVSPDHEVLRFPRLLSPREFSLFLDELLKLASRAGKENFVARRRRSRRGGGGGRRELLVAAIIRLDGPYRYRRQVVPYIRMSGRWLERLGFRSGDRIEITEEPERLVLTVRRDDRELAIR